MDKKVFYAYATSAFYASFRESILNGTAYTGGNRNIKTLYAIATGAMSVWFSGWNSVMHSDNPDGVAKAAGINGDKLVEMYCDSMIEGYSLAGDTGADPELLHKAAFHYAMERIYENGRKAAERVAK